MLTGKKILVGITGGIAAYKTPSVVRLLIKEGCEVRVIMTDHARDFITPLTLSTLSRNPVLTDFFNPGDGSWNSHIDLGLWADLILIAPATANTMAKMAAGIADNLLLATFLSARCLSLWLPRWTSTCSAIHRQKQHEDTGIIWSACPGCAGRRTGKRSDRQGTDVGT